MSVQRTSEGGVTVVTIDRPDARNAIDPETTLELDRTFNELEHDDAVKAVVLTGSGTRAFCSGMDMKAFLAGAGDKEFLTERGFAGLTRRRFSKPLVAAVNGAALGGGFELVLTCDLVVAAPNSAFGFPEVKVGHISDEGGLIWLARRIPFAMAMEMVLTGNPITADEAHRYGLVNRVVPIEALVKTACELAASVAANAPLAVHRSKTLLRDSLWMSERVAWETSRGYGVEIRASHDAREGVKAFLERREPMWRGQ